MAATATIVSVVAIALFKGVFRYSITPDQVIAMVASLGSCAAAAATYLTVREMKAGRIAAARGRLTTPGSDTEIRFLWQRSRNLAPSISPQRVIIRNASAGVAHNIRASWECAFDIAEADIKRINSWLGKDQHISIASGTVDFYDSNLKTSYVVAAKDDLLYLGDLGPSQDVFCPISQPILGMIFLKWASLLSEVARGECLQYTDVPLVKLSLIHDSPYEKKIKDELLIRFELVGHSIKLRSEKELSEALGGKWARFEIAVAFETTARSLYDIPKVVAWAEGSDAS